MLQVQYTADQPDLDQPVHDAIAARPGQPVRVRVAPTLLQANGNHLAWKGVAWTVTAQTAEDAIAVRHALEAFFAALSTVGSERVIGALTAPETP